jgi:phage minor structural protein
MAYEIWAYTVAGVKSAILENATSIQRKGKKNEVPTLSFTLPADDPKAIYITTAYEIKIWNTKKSRWEGLYTLADATDRWGSDGKYVDASYVGAMRQLVKEENVTYDTTVTPATPTAIVTALLALQEKTPAITVGTIEPTTTVAYAIENTNLLNALLELRSYLGGRMEVDDTRHLNWYNDVTAVTREVRYKKNMRGMTRKRDFTTVYNKIYAYGYGEGDVQLKLTDAGETYEYIEDATSQTAYGVLSKRITDKRIIHPSTLLRWAQLFLATYKDPIYSYTVEMVNLAEHPDFNFDLENIEVGQIIRVVNSDLNDLSVNVEVVSVDVNLSNPKDITVELANVTKDISNSFSDVAQYTDIAKNMAVQIGAGQVTVQGTFTVDGWRTTGQTTIDGGQITANTITCDKLTTSTLNAKTITLGTTGGNGIIESDNYVADTSGFQIDGAGNAEFNSVKIRGTLYACTLDTGNTMTVKGAIESDGFVLGSTGWKLTGTGTALFRTVAASFAMVCDGIISADGYIQSDVSLGLTGYTSAASARPGSIYTTDGTTLYWKDQGGTSHALY